jgi:superfamily I DNA/RNA helicase
VSTGSTEEIEEERRLRYVAMTREKNCTWLSDKRAADPTFVRRILGFAVGAGDVD